MNKREIKVFVENESINKNGILLLNYNNMKRVIEMCEKSQIQVLGIDTFSLQENRMQPLLDKSIDFSSKFIGSITPFEFIEQFDGSCKLLFEIIF